MATSPDDFLSDPVEILSLTISECYVYKVPPLRSASGHRAEDWKLDSPLFTGCLKVYQADTKLKVCIYSYKDPKNQSTTNDYLNLFGECPIEVKPGENIINFVDAVIDSSRYYVIRIKDPNSTRTTLLGIGFREREAAFDFKNILNDYVRYVNRMDLASQMAACVVKDDEGNSDSNTNKSNPVVQHINPLKEGEKIKINIGHSKKPTAHSSTTTAPAAAKGGFLLKPPPAPGSTVFLQVSGTNSNSKPVMSFNTGNREEDHSESNSYDPFNDNCSAPTTNEDDDWGDFSSS